EFAKKKSSLEAHEHLKDLVNKVMIRNRRHDTGLNWKQRHVETVPIQFSPSEQALYDEISRLKDSINKPASMFSIMTLQRECCSSREAVYMTLKKMLDQKEKQAPAIDEDTISVLIDRINQVTQNSKALQIVDLIKKIDDKVIIFTEYRATQIYLQWFLQQNGISSVPFRGGFKRGKKDWMKDLFRGKIQVLIATEAGGEGINLQFCNHMINYDLPWNPMRLEQRIGRIHRLGQERDVHIYNMATKHTVEEHILKLLYEKIHLFEKVVGELDDILTKIQVNNFEEHLHDILYHSATEEEMKIKMDNLTSFLSYKKQQPAEKRGS
ncbi:helicase-related protein, partial [Bacillus subtilis]|nr:helicase-related protein [Bacillus subtilis]